MGAGPVNAVDRQPPAPEAHENRGGQDQARQADLPDLRLIGDQAGGRRQHAHEDAANEHAAHRGREVDTAGDGLFATFDGPARAPAVATTGPAPPVTKSSGATDASAIIRAVSSRTAPTVPQ